MQNVSIIVTFEEQQTQLRQLLPQLLSLQYGKEYEVIVVDLLHDKDTDEWLEEMEVNYLHLHHTFCPTSVRGIDKYKLALTLGAKAASYEWLVILPVEASLPGDDWLCQLTCRQDVQEDIVIGITKSIRRWNWFTSYLFRRRFSLFRPTPFIVLCRRRCLLQVKAIKLSKSQIIRL